MSNRKSDNIIQKIADYYGLSVSELSKKVGYDRPQAFYDVINGKTKYISSKMAKAIVSVFPEINYESLLSEDGEFKINQANNLDEQILKTEEPINQYKNNNQNLNEMMSIVAAHEKTIKSYERLIEMLTNENEMLKLQLAAYNKQTGS